MHGAGPIHQHGVKECVPLPVAFQPSPGHRGPKPAWRENFNCRPPAALPMALVCYKGQEDQMVTSTKVEGGGPQENLCQCLRPAHGCLLISALQTAQRNPALVSLPKQPSKNQVSLCVFPTLSCSPISATEPLGKRKNSRVRFN